MEGSGGKIAKNIKALFIGQVITWLITLVWAIYLPRYLGDVDLGRYAIAMAIWAIMAAIVNTGTATHMTKEVARSPARAAELLGTVLIQRYCFIILGCVVVAGYTYLMQYSRETIVLICILGLASPATQTIMTMNAVFQGLEAMEYLPIIDTFAKGSLLIVSLALMYFKLSINEIAATFVVVTVLSAAIQFAILRRYIPIRMTWNSALSSQILQKSWPYFVSSLVLIAYGEIDKLILPILVNERAVGWFSVAATLSGTLIFIPNILTTSIFPALSRGLTEPGDTAVRILRKSLDITLICGVPMGLGLAVVASPLVDLVYGARFHQSGPVLSVLSVMLIFTYVATVTGRFLVAFDRTHSWTLALIAGVALAFPLNFMLIPWTDQAFGNGAIGAALRLAITELCMAIFSLWMVPRGILTRDNASTAVRTFIAGGVMLAACWYVREMFIAIPVLVGIVTYTLMITVLRVLKPEDIEMIRKAVRGAVAAIRTGGRNVSGAGERP